MKKITIAIDGHSSCGKSTMAKDLAREVGYVYVDTGAMYRSVTLYALRHNLFNADGSVKTAELEQQMSRRELQIASAGSIAEASLKLSGIFEAAQKAADQYLYNVRRRASTSQGGQT